ncbi:hypothetical protein Hanom_Chr15g01361071 [Helianthus anomalus]
MMFLNIKNIPTTDLSVVKKHARARSNLTLNTLTRFNVSNHQFLELILHLITNQYQISGLMDR